MIRFHGVSFSYRSGAPVLKGVEFQIPAGLTLLLGPNGAGKTTLLRVAAGIERPEKGTAELAGHDLWKEEVPARRTLAYVPEQPDLTPYASIRDVLNLVCRLRGVPLAVGTEALEKAGLAALGHSSIRELSMGQRRRAVLAAAWIGEPRVILLDEPLEGMDRVLRARILDWVGQCAARGAAIVIATHDLEPYVESAARALTVRDGNCRLVYPLPDGRDERLALLDALSRGLEPPAPGA